MENKSDQKKFPLNKLYLNAIANIVSKKIIITHSALKEPLEYIERVEKFTLADFTTMFEKQGLHIQEVYGDYNFASYDINTSQRLIMIASKKTTNH